MSESKNPEPQETRQRHFRPPRYDEVYFEGIAWLDSLEDEAGLPEIPIIVECNNCGQRPFHMGLMDGIEVGEQCPCCFLDDYDCDGIIQKTT